MGPGLHGPPAVGRLPVGAGPGGRLVREGSHDVHDPVEPAGAAEGLADRRRAGAVGERPVHRDVGEIVMRRTRRPGRPAIPRGGGRSLAPVAAILTGLLLWSIVDGAAASGGSARRDGSSRPGRPHAATGQVTAHDGAFWLGSTTI